MTEQASLAGAVLVEQAHANDDAPHTTKPKRNVSDYVAPVIGFGFFVGLWYFMSYWGLVHIWDKPSFLITPPHRVINESFLDATSRTKLLTGLYWTARVSLEGLLIAII